MSASIIPIDIAARTDRIIDAVLNGASLREAVKNEGIPLFTFHAALSRDRELSRRYSLAQEFRGDVLADEIISIADTDEDAARARNRIEARKWLASKFNKRYGDRLELNVSQSLDISATLLEAKARSALPVRDQLQVIDAQVVDLPSVSLPGAHDKQSLDVPAPGAEPDIFS